MEFIETPTFTRLLAKLMDDNEYSKLQVALVRRHIWMLLAYRKNEKDDLSRDEMKQLKRLVETFEA